MHLCILENDDLGPPLAQRYTRLAAMFERLALARFMIRFGQYGLSA